MLSEQNFEQRKKLLALQAAWLEFKYGVLIPGTDFTGPTAIEIRDIHESLRVISDGSESWAKGGSVASPSR
jgi:hypothetical protein